MKGLYSLKDIESALHHLRANWLKQPQEKKEISSRMSKS